MTFQIRVLPFAASVECNEGETVLSAVLRQGYFIRYGCRHGGCGTCKVSLVQGEVDGSGSSFALSPAERSQGWVLACSSCPVSDCTVDATTMELSDDEFEGGDPVTWFETELVEFDYLTPDIVGISLALVEPAEMSFVAGQFVNIEVPGTDMWRSYSIANAPHDSTRVELIIKLLPGGRFSSHIASDLAVGDRLRMLGPLGELRLRLSHRRIIMVAGGSGLAPIISMLRDMIHRGRHRDVELIFGARRRTDLYRIDELEHLAAASPQLDLVPALSEPEGASWPGEIGLVTEVIARRHTTLDGFDAYLAGPPPMIDATVPLLHELGVRPQNVYFDAFVPAMT